jgi:hypothetical protein
LGDPHSTTVSSLALVPDDERVSADTLVGALSLADREASVGIRALIC